MRLGLLLVAFAISFSSMARDTFALTNCQKLYAKYDKAKGHKAFATTMGNDPGFHPTSCSFVAAFSLKKLAEKKAVTECNKNRRLKDGGKCRVISSR